MIVVIHPIVARFEVTHALFTTFVVILIWMRVDDPLLVQIATIIVTHRVLNMPASMGG